MISESEQIPKREKTLYIIRKVVQAFMMLEEFSEEVDELSLSEMSRRLGVPERAALVLAETLKGRSYLEQNSYNGHYRLGFKTLELAQHMLRQTDLYRISHPVLASVLENCHENCSVAVLRRTHVIELDAVLSEHPVRVVSRLGIHLPVHCTAAGKLLVAHQKPEVQEKLLESLSLEGYTAKTITDPDRLREEWKTILERGYAVDDEEHDRDVRAVAAPIREFTGGVVGALVICGPSCRVSRERMIEELLPLALQGAAEISGRMGYRPDQALHEKESQNWRAETDRALRPPPRRRRSPGAATAI